jgi:threonine dehydratase
LASRTAPTLADITAARVRIAGIARETPVMRSDTLSKMTGRDVQLKAENLQRTGSFKIRGAYNRIALLSDDEREAGVVAASAGNHGQAVAWAAREAGARATIFVPQDAPMAKVEAARGYGAACEMGGALFDEALASALAYADDTGATFIHAFEDERVIAGQGTIGLELAAQLPEDATIVIPVGGGGLAAGIGLALRASRPHARIVGVQAGKGGYTIADGIFVKHLGDLTTSIIADVLDDVVEVTDDEIAAAIVLLLERTKLLVEGAGAVSVAALLAGRVGGGDGPVCAILSGGNIDATLLISVMRHGLSLGGRYLVVRTTVPDRPGELLKLLDLVAKERVNVVAVGHHREGAGIHVAETGVELTLQTRDEEHCESVLDAIHRWGYRVERLR